jgi:hypothetical protein
MAEKVLIEFQIVQKGKKISVIQKETDKLAKSTDKSEKATRKHTKTTDKYNRVAKGAAGISSNQTKNFSKMQQSVDGGGGGSGGLVRAYALLAANVFALTAAFGVLSRSAQVDTLTASIERLEIVSGKSIRSVARDLQAASGFSLDFANSLRSTSLALSAGFDSSTISELGKVAKNAAVSLGRPLADSLDRIFRGVIKVEPELLDEIGLFVRVDEAASKYADSIGIAAAELTEFQKRTAFANEAITQGKDKFEAFADVDVDGFAVLAASFADLAQNALSFVNSGLVPIIQYLESNKGLLIGLFAAIGLSILKSIVPAMGQFRQSARNAAISARDDFADFKKELQNNAEIQRQNAIAAKENGLQQSQTNLKVAQSATKKTRAYQSEAKGLVAANTQLKNATTLGEKSAALDAKIVALTKSKNTAKGATKNIISNNITALKAEKIATDELIASELELKAAQVAGPASIATPQKGSFMALEDIRLQKATLRSLALENVSTTASTEGLRNGFARLKIEMLALPPVTATNAVGFGLLSRASFLLSGSLTILSIKMSELMLKMAPFMPLIMIAVVAFPMLTRAMGFGGAEAEKYGQAVDKTSELLDTFSDKLEHSTTVMNNSESSMSNIVDAQLAFRNAIAETSQTLIDQGEAYDEYVKNTNQFVRFFTDFGRKGFTNQIKDEVQALSDILANIDNLGIEGEAVLLGQTSLQNLEKARSINAEIANTEALRAESEKKRQEAFFAFNRGEQFAFGKMKDQERESAKLNKLIKELEKERLKISGEINRSKKTETSVTAELAKQQSEAATAFEFSKSAIDGAVDAAREFKKQYITKSNVDKPLSSFKQITASLAFQNKLGEDTNLAQEDRIVLLKRVADDQNDILTLMTEENRIAFKANQLSLESAKTEQERTKIIKAQLKILDEQESFYEKTRLNQIATKNLLTENKKLLKLNANIEKETLLGVEKKFILLKRERQLNLDNNRQLLETSLIASNLTKEEVSRLAKMEVNAELLKEIGKLTTKEGEALSSILLKRQLILDEIQHEIDAKTESFRQDIQQNKILQKRLESVDKLNKLQLESSKIARSRGEFAETGSTTLRNSRQQELLIQTEATRLKTAEAKAKIEKDIIKAQFSILKAEAKILDAKAKEKGITTTLSETIQNLQGAEQTLIRAIDLGLENSAKQFSLNLVKGFEKGFSSIATEIASGASNEGFAAFIDQLSLGEVTLTKLEQNKKKLVKTVTDLQAEIADINVFNPMAGAQLQLLNIDLDTAEIELAATKFEIMAMRIDLASASIMRFATQVQGLGGDGAVAASLAQFSSSMIQSFSVLGATLNDSTTKTDKFIAAANAMSTVMAGFSAVLQADTKRRIDNIDQAIEAEKRLDGKSAQSVEKIKQMEAKKEVIARKSFETNKKLQIAQAIISTASGAAAAYAIPVIGPALAAMIVALGMAQVAIIKKTSYQSTASNISAPNTSLTVGQRGSAVDTAQQTTSGELNYLRGGRTEGTNLGGAGGAMGRKGYANGGEGIIVGERGPEIVSPSAPVDITPNFALGGGETNVNFTINAVDATGVEDLLINQRGNLIRMIREAANENGEEFLPTIDPMAYGSKT